MSRYILLDAGVVGLLCSSPQLPNVIACLNWLDKAGQTGGVALIADVTVYEVRRELVRLGASAKLTRLETFCDTLASEAVSAAAWIKAAEFWR